MSISNDFISVLLQHGSGCFKARAIATRNIARCQHKKIPYAEIGAALRRVAANLTDEQLGKLFLKDEV
jgi:hypothetical protein